jgi:endogenous inhibitor of DNA gyrase (YacG/DUF329 family)
MHCEPVQAAMRSCPYCETLFAPRRRWEAFCSSKCRLAFDVDRGAQGRVVSVRRLRRGVSVVVHLHGPAAERALNFTPGETVNLVKRP